MRLLSCDARHTELREIVVHSFVAFARRNPQAQGRTSHLYRDAAQGEVLLMCHNQEALSKGALQISSFNRCAETVGTVYRQWRHSHILVLRLVIMVRRPGRPPGEMIDMGRASGPPTEV